MPSALFTTVTKSFLALCAICIIYSNLSFYEIYSEERATLSTLRRYLHQHLYFPVAVIICNFLFISTFSNLHLSVHFFQSSMVHYESSQMSQIFLSSSPLYSTSCCAYSHPYQLILVM